MAKKRKAKSKRTKASKASKEDDNYDDDKTTDDKTPAFPCTLHRLVYRQQLEPYLALIPGKLRKLLTELNLRLPKGVPLTADFDYKGDKSRRFGNRVVKKGTLINYKGIMRQMWAFFAYKGDYMSMLMLLSKAPKGCPSMDVNSLEQFLKYKFHAINSPLVDVDGHPVLDILGVPMKCEGLELQQRMTDLGSLSYLFRLFPIEIF